MKNTLLIILILVLAAMGFGYYQYLSAENNTNPEVEDIVKNIIEADEGTQANKKDIILYPIDTSATELTVLKDNSKNGMATKASDAITFFTVDLYSDLADPEQDKKYSAWLTGGVAPDAYFYLGDLEKEEDKYRISYATGDIYEGMLSFDKIVVSLENKKNDSSKPSSYLLEGYFNQQEE
ncbi:hypothetical protein C0580_01230 [Candidatus Parcubacteria bacterium]|nr:MAG: hypothetical protein C0580_01230 [Candidatus Parcubacteria bacterium]